MKKLNCTWNVEPALLGARGWLGDADFRAGVLTHRAHVAKMQNSFGPLAGFISDLIDAFVATWSAGRVEVASRLWLDQGVCRLLQILSAIYGTMQKN